MSGDASPPQGPDLAGGIPLAALEDGQPFLAASVKPRSCWYAVAPRSLPLVRHAATTAAPWPKDFSWGTPSLPLASRVLLAPERADPARPCPARRSGLEDHHPYGRVYLAERVVPPPVADPPTASPASIVVVGAGAAGSAAVEALRSGGYRGPLPWSIRIQRRRTTVPTSRRTSWQVQRRRNSSRFRRAPLFRSRRGSTGGARRSHPANGTFGTTRDGRSLSWEPCCWQPALPRCGPPCPGSAYLMYMSCVRSATAARSWRGPNPSHGWSSSVPDSSASRPPQPCEPCLAVSVIGRDAIPFARLLCPELSVSLLAQHRSHVVSFHLQRTVKRSHRPPSS